MYDITLPALPLAARIIPDCVYGRYQVAEATVTNAANALSEAAGEVHARIEYHAVSTTTAIASWVGALLPWARIIAAIVDFADAARWWTLFIFVVVPYHHAMQAYTWAANVAYDAQLAIGFVGAVAGDLAGGAVRYGLGLVGLG